MTDVGLAVCLDVKGVEKRATKAVALHVQKAVAMNVHYAVLHAPAIADTNSINQK